MMGKNLKCSIMLKPMNTIKLDIQVVTTKGFALNRLQKRQVKRLLSQCLACCDILKYCRISLSRTRLFRITAYLEVKIWSLF